MEITFEDVDSIFEQYRLELEVEIKKDPDDIVPSAKLAGAMLLYGRILDVFLEEINLENQFMNLVNLGLDSEGQKGV